MQKKMQSESSFPPTILWRHRKENLKKCSLRGLEGRSDCLFVTYPTQALPEIGGYILLQVGAPPLRQDDADRGLLLVDATWRYAALMLRQLGPFEGKLLRRSIPSGYRTAYPRYQTGCPHPESGLASIEALYLAYQLLGRETCGLLDSYHWKEDFLHGL